MSAPWEEAIDCDILDQHDNKTGTTLLTSGWNCTPQTGRSTPSIAWIVLRPSAGISALSTDTSCHAVTRSLS